MLCKQNFSAILSIVPWNRWSYMTWSLIISLAKSMNIILTHCVHKLPPSCSSHPSRSPACRACPPGRSTRRWCTPRPPEHLDSCCRPGALCTRLRLVAHPLCQGAGPGLVTVPLQLTVSTIVADVTVLIQIVSEE